MVQDVIGVWITNSTMEINERYVGKDVNLLV